MFFRRSVSAIALLFCIASSTSAQCNSPQADDQACRGGCGSVLFGKGCSERCLTAEQLWANFPQQINCKGCVRKNRLFRKGGIGSGVPAIGGTPSVGGCRGLAFQHCNVKKIDLKIPMVALNLPSAFRPSKSCDQNDTCDSQPVPAAESQDDADDIGPNSDLSEELKREKFEYHARDIPSIPSAPIVDEVNFSKPE